MTRTELDRRLAELLAELLQMGESVGFAVSSAMDALARYDRLAAEAVAAGDDDIDRLCRQIEASAERVITLHQPAVRDLRSVLAVLAVAEDLERVGDYAEGIARLVMRMPQQPDPRAISDLATLAALSRVQLQDALDAFRATDAARAREVWLGDAVVDGLHQQLVQVLMGRMSHDTDELATATYLLWVAHNLERIADRAANICERAVFVATGERRVRAAAS